MHSIDFEFDLNALADRSRRSGPCSRRSEFHRPSTAETEPWTDSRKLLDRRDRRLHGPLDEKW